MRDQIVAGNWKMNCDVQEMKTLLSDLKKQDFKEEVKVMVAPSYTNLYPAKELLEDSRIEVAAQNMHEAESGAFTGEVSAKMLTSLGLKTVILGHSERRSIYKESHELLAAKVKSALANGLHIIFCIGEELEARKSEKQVEVVKKQLTDSVFGLSASEWENIILAYEPVWAIGTGETASPQQAQDMHAEIRKMIADTYSSAVAEKISILYGGSVKPNNAQEIFAMKDVDGGLIGGAALKAKDFTQIINSF
ncbi:triose-phosphate isomerase [Mesonia sp. MT50]|uniref:Triosephosphate isomerase n=1 Tax=Mesonia profundi TaxID=3070998 RepID=A0ABU1A209_9FLAO|nr:triose-phosphate isomerase [Mesonia profundi]MDQ7917731.1 triose-phosphate isomerase [Mesonia profundi]